MNALGIFLFAYFLIFPLASEAKYNAVEVKLKKRQLDNKLNKNRSGVGSIRVQKALYSWLSKKARKTTRTLCRKKYRKQARIAKKRIKNYAESRSEYSFRGRWQVHNLDTAATFEIHFTDHHFSTDFVAGEILDLSGNLVNRFTGYQRFNKFNGLTNEDRYRYSLLMIGIKTSSNPLLKGTETDRILRKSWPLGGNRTASPF